MREWLLLKRRLERYKGIYLTTILKCLSLDGPGVYAMQIPLLPHIALAVKHKPQRETSLQVLSRIIQRFVQTFNQSCDATVILDFCSAAEGVVSHLTDIEMCSISIFGTFAISFSGHPETLEAMRKRMLAFWDSNSGTNDVLTGTVAQNYALQNLGLNRPYEAERWSTKAIKSILKSPARNYEVLRSALQVRAGIAIVMESWCPFAIESYWSLYAEWTRRSKEKADEYYSWGYPLGICSRLWLNDSTGAGERIVLDHINHINNNATAPWKPEVEIYEDIVALCVKHSLHNDACFFLQHMSERRLNREAGSSKSNERVNGRVILKVAKALAHSLREQGHLEIGAKLLEEVFLGECDPFRPP